MMLQGCGTALITPFCPDGSIDEPSLHALVKWQIECGVSFLIPCGTTGEASTLTAEETDRVVQIVCATSAGRVPVFAGCTHNSTTEAVLRARRLARIHGLTGLLTANPYYNRPSQEGQYQHFKAVADAVDLPVLLYNIPGRTGANLEPGTVRRLMEIPNIAGLKESSGNLAQITELLTTLPGSFPVYAGDDGLALPFLALGAAGLISVASNIVPRETSQMVAAGLRGDWGTARALNRRLYPLMKALFVEPSPAPVKAVLHMMGYAEEVLRLPMVPVGDETHDMLEGLIERLGLLHDVPVRESNLIVL